MKKSSIVIAITAFIVMLAGMAYIAQSYVTQNKHNGEVAINDIEIAEVSKQESEKIEFLEFKHTLTREDIISVRYMKAGSANRIYSLYPVDNKSQYDISSSGSAAVYVSKDGQLWAFYSNGNKKVIVPDKYGSFEKSDLQKKINGYVWVEKPFFTQEGNIQFYSNLPDISKTPKKSVWELDIDDNSMQKVYTPSTVSFKQIGYRSDKKLMFQDGDNIAAVSNSGDSIEKIDVKDKQVLSLSPDGSKILFYMKDKLGHTDFKNMYIMDSWGKNAVKLPYFDGTATLIGSWYNDSSRYAFVVRSLSGNKDKVAVLMLREGSYAISTHDIANGIKIPDTSSLHWSGDNSVSIDKGDEIIDVSIK